MVALRGVVSQPLPERIRKEDSSVAASAKTRLPDLIKNARLKVNRSFVCGKENSWELGNVLNKCVKQDRKGMFRKKCICQILLYVKQRRG